MLILSRKINEQITIGENAEIVISVVGICGGQIRIGVSAPKSVMVHRKEIYDRIKSSGNKEEKTQNITEDKK